MIFGVIATRLVYALFAAIIITTVAMVSLSLGALWGVDRVGWRVREDATKLRGGLHPARTLCPLSLVLGFGSR